MRISSWAAMTKRHLGRQWHCRTIRTFNLDYVSPPQAMQWPDARSKHTRQWLGCGNSIPRCGFPISKMCGALIGVPKTSRDTKKDCEKPGCPNDHRSQVLAGGDDDRMTSANGTFRTWRDVRLESVMRTKADVRRPLQVYGFTPQQTFSEACGAPLRPALILPDGQISHLPVQPHLQKYFPSRLTQITSISLTVSFHRG